MAKAGRFEIHVSQPYPCWARLSVDGREIASLHHGELVDLRYAVEKAIQEAYRELNKVRSMNGGTDPKVELQLP